MTGTGRLRHSDAARSSMATTRSSRPGGLPPPFTASLLSAISARTRSTTASREPDSTRRRTLSSDMSLSTLGRLRRASLSARLPSLFTGLIITQGPDRAAGAFSPMSLYDRRHLRAIPHNKGENREELPRRDNRAGPDGVHHRRRVRRPGGVAQPDVHSRGLCGKRPAGGRGRGGPAAGEAQRLHREVGRHGGLRGLPGDDRAGGAGPGRRLHGGHHRPQACPRGAAQGLPWGTPTPT